jgi:hypothetical protein
MSKESTESLQGDVWACPRSQCWVNGFYDIVQDGKVTIMQAAPPDELPYAFNRIEFRAVRRQKMQTKMIVAGTYFTGLSAGCSLAGS